MPDDAGGAGFDPVDPDAPLRGWIAPEDRLWRHPSEMRASAATGSPRRARTVNRWVAATVGVVGAAAVAGAAVAVTGGAGPSATPLLSATATSLTTIPLASDRASGGRMDIGSSVMQIVQATRPSLVTVVADDGDAPSATGVVLPPGTLVATAAGPLGTTTHFDVVSSDGRHHAGQLLGADSKAGIAVVALTDRLTPASFADEEVRAQQLALTACLCAGSRQAATRNASGPGVAIGTVHEVGTAATVDGGPALVDAIEAEMPLGSSSWGTVLLDDHGAVLGVLDGTRSDGADVFDYFVPAALVLGVAHELAAAHSVVHGWLGLVCSDAPAGGAQVTAVMTGSPAAGAGLRAGDVVEAVSAHPVRSLAELRARLYTSPPGTPLTLSVLRGGSVVPMIVTVAATPS